MDFFPKNWYIVMAGTEHVSGQVVEENSSSRLEWLQQRREMLQEKLLQKNNELKNLCIEEAEITGILPPEIPLEPGESPPTFRRKVGTSFSYPQNLINKLKSSEVEESTLELERQVQVGIAEAALGIINDSAESKAVRRKHRLVYQQSQRRLQELDARLNFIRQSHGKAHRQSQLSNVSYCPQPHLQTTMKHRTKKPRPPLDRSGSEENARTTGRGILVEGGVSLSPLSGEQNYNTYPGYMMHDPDQSHACPVLSPVNQNHSAYPVSSPMDHRQSQKLLGHDLNDNHNVYILPENCRSRTYSHGSGSNRPPHPDNHYLDTDRNYRAALNACTEQERVSSHYRHSHRQQLLEPPRNSHQQCQEYKHMDPEVQRRPVHHQQHPHYEAEYRDPRYTHPPGYQVPMNARSSHRQPSLQRDREAAAIRSCRNAVNTTDESLLPPGYWMRCGEEIVWCPEDPAVIDRFGSLDRRKQSGSGSLLQQQRQKPRQHHSTVSTGFVDAQTHHNVNAKSPPAHPRQHPFVSPNQMGQGEQVATPGKTLLRTQSLGNVETWNMHSGYAYESIGGKDTIDNANRKGKERQGEKERGWFETSLDSSSIGSNTMSSSPSMSAHDAGSLVSPESYSSRSNLSSGPCSMPRHPHRMGSASPDFPLGGVPNVREPDRGQSVNRQSSRGRSHPRAPRVLEIPAESKPVDIGDSPHDISKNCTIVQPGKYQPYREVTKPFEMSDFYKYSTKYRKKNSENAQGQNSATPHGKPATTSTSSSPQTPPPLTVSATIKATQGDARVETMVEISREILGLGLMDGSEENRTNVLASPVQKRIYQPVQRMTCQPYGALR
ncbi:FERM domain-containing protein 4A isoform X2 [Orussus abietinus]|uniref:FERM domain-containing protein 4A isoform X2 n=1 Tax=Orussus abietinus TaxID=222816 RepID=UPI000C715FA1|nr:FERM domain-containing protein 4A isoform X2 [Orussus abietinus]